MVDESWSHEELKASVEAYMKMLDAERAGSPMVKAQLYRDLAAKFGRTEKAFEFRMQNISYVRLLQGRTWIQGLKPARNVGANVAAVIEKILAEFEGSSNLHSIEMEATVQERVRSKFIEPPAGVPKPGLTSSSVTEYRRDVAVKAWVLQQANGRCECCEVEAPFVRADGLPYLEVHHVRQMVDGGSDTIHNTVAICPNCHRELHFGMNAHGLISKLYDRVHRLIRE